MISKNYFEEFMEEQGITYSTMYYIDDDLILDKHTIDSIENILFDEPKEFKKIKVYWIPNTEIHSKDLDIVLQDYEEEWIDFCNQRNLNYEDEIEIYGE